MAPEPDQAPVTSPDYESTLAREPGVRRAVIAGGSATALGGEIAIALALLGLAGVVPWILTPVAAIVVGLSLLFGGGVVAGLYGKRLERHRGAGDAWAVVGGMTLEALCGAAGVALGLLALVEVAPATMLSVAVVALGAAILVGGGALCFLQLFPARPERSTARLAAEQAMIASSGTQALVGAGAAALGLLALAGVGPLLLSRVALLILGAGLMLNGSAMVAHAWSASRA